MANVNMECADHTDKASANSSAFISKSAILDGKYFTVIEIADDNVKVKAKCVTKTVISGATNALSNFTMHLKVSYLIRKQ